MWAQFTHLILNDCVAILVYVSFPGKVLQFLFAGGAALVCAFYIARVYPNDVLCCSRDERT